MHTGPQNGLTLNRRSVNFSQGVMLTTPFTLGVYMVRDYLAKASMPGEPVIIDERAVGRLTGLLVSMWPGAVRCGGACLLVPVIWRTCWR